MSDRATPRPCDRVLADISAYLDGELGPALCDRIDRHCAECSACRSLVDGLRRTTGLCRQESRAPIPDDVRARARASIQRLLDPDRD